jgi:hypothetical protein
MKKPLRALLVAGALFCLPNAHADDMHGVFAAFRDDFVFAPTFSHFMACADIGCETRLTSGISSGEANSIRALFASVSNAAQERKAISQALGKFELYVGRQEMINTWDDRAGNSNFGHVVNSRQTDCFAESHNATTYLLVLAGAKLLRFHTVGDIMRRGMLFDQHFAALIIDKSTKANFIVDTWFLANAYPAVIMPYDDWEDKNDDLYIKAAKALR